jgi:hypothetical protein
MRAELLLRKLSHHVCFRALRGSYHAPWVRPGEDEVARAALGGERRQQAVRQCVRRHLKHSPQVYGQDARWLRQAAVRTSLNKVTPAATLSRNGSVGVPFLQRRSITARHMRCRSPAVGRL